MSEMRSTLRLLIPAALLLAACGGSGDVLEGLEELGTMDEPSSDDGATGGSPAINADTGVSVTVDGVEYNVDTNLGGSCDTQGDADSGDDLRASGYDVETGSRVELSFSRQSAEFSPSGQEEFYGSVFVAIDEGGDWQVMSLEPWPWLEGDRSRVTGTVTMEDFDGLTAEVSFDITCP